MNTTPKGKKGVSTGMATKIGITEARGQFIVVDEDGNQYGTYDDRKKAAAKAREVKRGMEDGNGGGSSSGGSGLQDKAAKFSQGVNKRLGAGESGSTEEAGGTPDKEPGRFQQFATSFADGVNETVKGSGDTEAEETGADEEESQASGPLQNLMGGGGGESDGESPSLPMMGGGGGDGDGEDGGPSLAFMGDVDNDNDPEFGFMGDMDGDGEPAFAMFERNSDADDETALPGLGLGGGPDQGQLPFGGTGSSEDGGPSIPGFGIGMQESDGDEENGEMRFPWM